jgi:hypothetical protein
MNKMRNSGRISTLTIGVLAMVAMIGGAFLFAKPDASSAAATFMDGLARGDVKTLVDLSLIGKTNPTEIEQAKKKLTDEWDFAVNTAGKHYIFLWKISGSVKASDTHASVIMKVTKTPQLGGYEEKFELPMEQEGGKWKVDVGGISTELFPALPRT